MLLEIMALKKEAVAPKTKYASQGWNAATDSTRFSGGSSRQDGTAPGAKAVTPKNEPKPADSRVELSVRSGIDDTRAPDAWTDEARFCEWALQKLGHVALFAFSGLEASPFMIVAENGERTRGATLAIALQEMIACQEASVRKPLYRPTWDERAGSEGVVDNPR